MLEVATSACLRLLERQLSRRTRLHVLHSSAFPLESRRSMTSCSTRSCCLKTTLPYTRNTQPNLSLTTQIKKYHHRRLPPPVSIFEMQYPPPKAEPAKASSPQSTTRDPLIILKYIESEIFSLYTAASTKPTDETPPHLARSKYLDIYTAIHDYDLATKKRDSPVSGEYLYHWLGSQMRDYCTSTRGYIFRGQHDDNDASSSRHLLTTYLSCYRKFGRLATLVANLMQCWERHWLRRVKDEKKISVGSIEELHKLVWRQEVLESNARDSVSKTVLEELHTAMAVLEETRYGTREDDLGIVKDVVQSLSCIGFTIGG